MNPSGQSQNVLESDDEADGDDELNGNDERTILCTCNVDMTWPQAEHVWLSFVKGLAEVEPFL